jgi:hypothetical protein
VAINAIFIQSCFFAIVIGIIKTSGGIGKTKLSIKDIIPKKIFEFLCPARFIVLKYNSLNIFSFIILNVLILLFILYEIYYLWANGGTGRRVGLKIPRIHKLITPWYSLGHSERVNTYFLFLTLQLARAIKII